MLLLESTVILVPLSSVDPAILVAHIPIPLELYLTINTSAPPINVNVGGEGLVEGDDKVRLPRFARNDG
jgi:hypothetical protein